MRRYNKDTSCKVELLGEYKYGWNVASSPGLIGVEWTDMPEMVLPFILKQLVSDTSHLEELLYF